jgi:hypothetical protein
MRPIGRRPDDDGMTTTQQQKPTEITAPGPGRPGDR